jgi:hypothetical protein
MTRSATPSGLIRVGIGFGMLTALTGGSARAVDGPLLVVVEAPPALDADAAEIRRAIGTELHSRTVAPMKTPTETSDRALIVALDRDRIAMSLRTSDAAPVARSIPAPPERAARLRAIAWLAGNLARDQVTPILAEAPIEMPSLATLPPPATTSATTEPPPLPSLPSSGYPVSESPPAADSTTTISTRFRDQEPAGSVRWSISAADGPTTGFPVGNTNGGLGGSGPGAPQLYNPFRSGFWNGFWGSAWRIDVQRRTKANGPFVGAALGGTAGDWAPQLLGVTAFVGSARHLGHWSFEPTIGAGLELAEVSGGNTVLTQSSNDTTFTTTETTSNALRPALCADATIAIGHPVSDSLDAFVRLGLHATTIGLDNWFLSATLGLRYNL